MRERVYSFLVVLLLMFSGEIFGQVVEAKPVPVYSASSIYNKNSVLTSPLILMADNEIEKNLNLNQVYIVITAPVQLKSISPSLYKDGLGFVCKKEWQLEKFTSVPFRFRLGSLEYVNYLERKPNAVKPVQ